LNLISCEIAFMNKFLLILIFTGFSFAQVQVEDKPTLAVMPLAGANISPQDLKIYSDRLEQELFITKKYTLVEREMMNTVLEEQGFQQSGCTTDECAVQIGQLLGVQQLISGSIGKIGDIYSISIKIIDIETAEIINREVYDCPCKPDELLTMGIKNAIGNISGAINNDIVSQNKNTTNSSEGILEIYSTPSNVRVHIGSKYVGKTPLTLIEYPQGNYSLMLIHPSYKTYRSKLNISKGEGQILNIELEKK